MLKSKTPKISSGPVSPKTPLDGCSSLDLSVHADTGLCLTEREGLPSFLFSSELPPPSSAL